ncbi:MAG: T9SS type A sorting domain-containing protein, partial [Bacteroidota bacterium]|nr:T9SS type A sorting domain-containing protein [Bacteroidota bacterium]
MSNNLRLSLMPYQASAVAVAVLIGSAITFAQLPTSVELRKPEGGKVYRAGTSQDLEWYWDTTGRGTVYPIWRFQFATSPSGPWQDLPGATSVKDSGRTRLRYAGGFRVPAIRTTTGYVRIVLLNSDGTLNEAVSDINDAPFTIDQPLPVRVDSVLRDPIRTTVTLSRKKIYGLDGYVFVDSGGVLRVEPGTVIVGDTVGQNSALCVNRGGIIYADGRPDSPIVFTSSALPGQRAPGDWGGILICGRARINNPGREAALEGGIADAQRVRGWFGGSDDNDSSGVLRYVRIEFAGIAAFPNQELNSLTMGGVGRRTVIEYVQVSYANDDAYEWFGGTVDGRYLISYAALDDDFDGDNGWRGRVQFGLVVRKPQNADVSTSQAFEMDNDAAASFNQPFTSPVFSNITVIGPLQDTAWSAGRDYNRYFGASIQIRRNARTSIFNSVIAGWPRGVEIANANTMAAAYADSLQLRNLSFFGIKGTWLNFAGGTPPSGMTTDWIAKPTFGNELYKQSPLLAVLNNPFAYDDNALFDPRPRSTAPYLTTASFERSGIVPIDDSWFQRVPYRGAFRDRRWDLPWANYDPIRADYTVSVGEAWHVWKTRLEIFPNPVQSEVVWIRYEVPHDSPVRLEIVTPLGEIVRQEVADYVLQGIYERPISLAGLGAGTYFVRLQTVSGTITQPLCR